MSRIITRPANLTDEQRQRMWDPEGMQEVVVDGIVVGQVGKNKHGVWLGHFDRAALRDSNPFAASRISHSVMPSVRGKRTKKNVVADVAAQQVGRYERYINAIGTANKLRELGVSHTVIYFGGPDSISQYDEWAGYVTDLLVTVLRQDADAA